MNWGPNLCPFGFRISEGRLLCLGQGICVAYFILQGNDTTLIRYEYLHM